MERLFACTLIFLLCHLPMMAQNLSETEVVKRYSAALSMMTKGNQKYAEARDILQEILPHANKDMQARILPKIPMSWYFEGMIHQLQQQYDDALLCMVEAQRKFHELGRY